MSAQPICAVLVALLASCAAAPPTATGSGLATSDRPSGGEGPTAVATAAPAPSSAPPADDPPPPAAEEPDGEPLPPGFVALSSAPDDADTWRPVTCGDLRVENVWADRNVYEPFVRVTGPDGRKVYEAHGRRYDIDAGVKARMSLVADVCGDLTGDGVPELILTERTMGAHCCYTHYVVSMTTPTRNLLLWEKGDSGNGLWPAKLAAGPGFQVRSVDLVMPPFDAEKGDPSVSYAGIPGFPVVFDLVGGSYQKRTFHFLDALRAERDAERRRCAARTECEPYELHEWGLALMLGDWATEKERLVPDPELRAALDRRSPEMLQLLKRQLGR